MLERKMKIYWMDGYGVKKKKVGASEVFQGLKDELEKEDDDDEAGVQAKEEEKNDEDDGK